jgi:hypothetical protein
MNLSYYVEWNEDSSDEDKGWYNCRVLKYFQNAHTLLESDDGAIEIVSLHDIKWFLAKQSSSEEKMGRG